MARRAFRTNNIISTRQCIPGGSGLTTITTQTKPGVLVCLDGVDDSPDEPKFGRLKVRLTNVATDKIYGVLMDYQTAESCVIATKGQIWVSWGDKTAPAIGNEVIRRVGSPGIGAQTAWSPTASNRIIDVDSVTIGGDTFPWALVDFGIPV